MVPARQLFPTDEVEPRPSRPSWAPAAKDEGNGRAVPRTDDDDDAAATKVAGPQPRADAQQGDGELQ